MHRQTQVLHVNDMVITSQNLSDSELCSSPGKCDLARSQSLMKNLYGWVHAVSRDGLNYTLYVPSAYIDHIIGPNVPSCCALSIDAVHVSVFLRGDPRPSSY